MRAARGALLRQETDCQQARYRRATASYWSAIAGATQKTEEEENGRRSR